MYITTSQKQKKVCKYVWFLVESPLRGQAGGTLVDYPYIQKTKAPRKSPGVMGVPMEEEEGHRVKTSHARGGGGATLICMDAVPAEGIGGRMTACKRLPGDASCDEMDHV